MRLTLAALVALPLLIGGCLDSSAVARKDKPPPLLALEDSLSAAHFRGLVAIEEPAPGTLRMHFRDPAHCRIPVDSLRRFAMAAASHVATVRVPRPLQRPRPIERVEVTLARTHRFGAMVWTTSLGRFDFPRGVLEAAARNAIPPGCEHTIPPQFDLPHD